MLERELQRLGSVVFVYVETIDRLDALRHRIALAEQHAVESATGACKLEPHMAAADDTLSNDVEVIEKYRLRKTLTPHGARNRACVGEQCLLPRTFAAALVGKRIR